MELIVKASHIEEELIHRLRKVMNDNAWLFAGEKVVLMADAHIGYTVPIGYTQTVTNNAKWVSPEMVGSDIGCGVTSYVLEGGLSHPELVKINEFIGKSIAINRNRRNFEEVEYPESFGTLGGGNHFIEIGKNNGELLLSVHSGSRTFGGDVYRKYNFDQRHDEYLLEREMILEELKAQGVFETIETTMQAYDAAYQKGTISVVRGDGGYFSEMKAAVEWAKASRRNMLDKILRFMKDNKMNVRYNRTIESIHNYIELEGPFPIVRKGSITAPVGSEVVIPLNMKDGIIVGTSSLTEEVNYSLPHGAGRRKSRSQALKELAFSDFEKSMRSVVSTSVVEKTLDESPKAYKNKKTIIKDIEPYLSEYKIFETILNFKGIN